MTDAGNLSGKSVLVVEDEFIVAFDLSQELTAGGAHVIGPMHTVGNALQAIGDTPIDAAVVDLKLQDKLAVPVAVALH